jgi:hypothetical protein
LFSIETLAISNIQLVAMFHLADTLCENCGTSNVMVRLKDAFVLHVVPHGVFYANRMEVSNVQLESSHATMAKLHDLST